MKHLRVGNAMDKKAAGDIIWQGKHLHIRNLDGWEFVSRNTRRPAVGIVAVHDDLRVVLVEQFRPPVETSTIEIPAGLTGDILGEEDEHLLEAARRELLEETGFEADHWQPLIAGFSSPGITDESITLFLARKLHRTGAGGGVDHENIKIHEIPLCEVFQWLQRGNRQADLKLFAGIYTAMQVLSLGGGDCSEENA
ncbi:MAG: NUDIX hydrolase [Planctomycetales bacterium]|nr:NUDIX hydrolase [Planctomycetales bacterium]